MKGIPKLIIIAIIINFSIILFAQTEIKSIGNYSYGKWGEEWYVNFNGEKGSMVDTDHLVVYLTGGKDLSDFNFTEIGFATLQDVRGRFAGGFYQLKIPDDLDPFYVGNKLLQSQSFEHVYLNTYSKISSHDPPDDTFYETGAHWNLDKIKMPEAWDISTGSNSIIVAVVDAGIDIDHPDLQNNIWNNTGYCFTGGECDADPGDDYHGTAVAGIIAAKLNNDLGVSGMAGGWTSENVQTNGVQLMSLRAGYGSDIDDAAAAAAIEFAVSNGARVINCSFNKEKANDIIPSLNSAIDNAVNTDNVLVVFSAGNRTCENCSNDIFWPANKPNVFTVGATTENDYRKIINDGTGEYWGSKYGSKLDVVAPGINIPTTDNFGIAGLKSTNYNPNFNGTSAAAPHVSALAALLLSVDPELSNSELKNIISSTADEVLGMNGNSFSNEYGHGRINAFNALSSISITAPPPPTNLIITNPTHYGNHPDLQWWASSGATSYNVYRQESNAPPWDLIGNTSSTSYTDDEVFILNQYHWNSDEYIYQVKAVNTGGESNPSNTASVWGESYYKQRDEITDIINPIPEAYALESNYPNPFNPTTTIKYELPEASSVFLVIYDLRGNEVTHWTLATESAGYKRKTWDATNKNGNKVPGGMYLLKMTAESKESRKFFYKTMKMVLLK